MVYRRTPSVVTRLEDNRARILAAARALVAEGGWRHAHVATVAEKAGVATGTVYRYFPSKAELFAEVLAIVSSRERDVIAAIVDGDGTPATRLRGAVQAFSKRALKGRRLAHAMIVEPCEPEIDEARLEWRAALGEEFVRLIRIGQQQGAFRDCDPRIAGAVWSAPSWRRWSAPWRRKASPMPTLLSASSTRSPTAAWRSSPSRKDRLPQRSGGQHD
jgi:AcrR family transcriptional regulator